MKREEILSKLGYTVPECKKRRVIVVSDINCEADDPFAIMHHMLTPSIELKGIIACHYEWTMRLVEQHMKEHPEMVEAAKAAGDPRVEIMINGRGKTMGRSYEEGELILKLAGVDDVPLLHGAAYELAGRDIDKLPESEGADFIIEEALKDDERQLYVCLLGGETDLAIALLKKPEIAEKITAIAIMGGVYPEGNMEFNCIQDVDAVNAIFESGCQYWQIPQNVYGHTYISFAELVSNIRPCGQIGKWMVDQMFEFQKNNADANRDFPSAEVWSIGDNPTVGVLLGEGNYHTMPAPHIREDGTYEENPNGNEIRVYDWYDVRLTVHDLMAKMKLIYG